MNLNENAVKIAEELIEKKGELNIEHFELEAIEWPKFWAYMLDNLGRA